MQDRDPQSGAKLFCAQEATKQAKWTINNQKAAGLFESGFGDRMSVLRPIRWHDETRVVFVAWLEWDASQEGY